MTTLNIKRTNYSDGTIKHYIDYENRQLGIIVLGKSPQGMRPLYAIYADGLEIGHQVDFHKAINVLLDHHKII